MDRLEDTLRLWDRLFKAQGKLLEEGRAMQTRSKKQADGTWWCENCHAWVEVHWYGHPVGIDPDTGAASDYTYEVTCSICDSILDED
jgi:hypothetical protein